MSGAYTHSGIQFNYELDAANGEVEIWRNDADGGLSLVDRIDVTDLLAGYVNNSNARAVQAIEQNAGQYLTVKHKWFEEDL